MTKTERERHARAIAVPDIEDRRKQWFTEGFNEGFKAGADAERARIQTVEEQGSILPGHEELVARLKYDGKTTGPEAAVQIIAAEKKKLGAIAEDLRADAGRPVVHSTTEDTSGSTQKIDALMSQDQVSDVAKREWEANPKLHHEFTGEAQYVAFRKAEAAGRIRVLNKRRVN
jgi:hypothetical protein